MKKAVIFWDVDTQRDFMDPGGKLYIPGAERIKPNLKRLTDYAHERRYHIVASSDDHVPGHRELSNEPDFEETFPEHCMRGTPGAAAGTHRRRRRRRCGPSMCTAWWLVRRRSGPTAFRSRRRCRPARS